MFARTDENVKKLLMYHSLNITYKPTTIKSFQRESIKCDYLIKWAGCRNEKLEIQKRDRKSNANNTTSILNIFPLG